MIQRSTRRETARPETRGREKVWHGSVAALLFTGALVAGCQPATPAPTATMAQPLPEFRPAQGSVYQSGDPCAERMQDIEEALAVYLLNNQNKLPDTLDQLKHVPGLGPGLNLTCPVTGQPYIYSAQGLFLPPESRDDRRVILWEPTASHHGARACLLMPRIEPGHGVAMEVKPIPEAEFKKAVPQIQ
jgi:hypothetical protein